MFSFVPVEQREQVAHSVHAPRNYTGRSFCFGQKSWDRHSLSLSLEVVSTVADRTKRPRRVDTVEAKDDRRRVEYVCICVYDKWHSDRKLLLREYSEYFPLSLRWGPWLKSKTSSVLGAVGGLSVYTQHHWQPSLVEHAFLLCLRV